MKLFSYLIVIMFAILQYVQMCIVSLRENYQIGIEKIQLFQPSIIILCLIALAIFCSGKTGKGIILFSKHFIKYSFIVCFVLLVFFFINDFSNASSQWTFPHQRTLIKTLKISLLHPEFSGRSLGILAYSIILLFVLSVVVKIKYKKTMHNMSLNSDG